MTEQGDLFGPSQAGQAQSEVERSLLADLLERSRLYHTSEDYRKLLDFVSKLRNFAPFNAMLLQIQRPGLDYAASEYDWRTRFNRTIKEDARPLLILWPFGPVAFVYDKLDTEGDELPADAAQSFHAMGPMTEVDIQKAIKGLATRGITVKLIDSGDGNAGKIEAKQRSTAKKERPDYQVRLNKNHERNVQFVTLVHELGHLGPDKHLGIEPRPKIEHRQRELEAESLAYLVCKRRGVQSKSVSYLAAYVKANVTVGSFDFYLLTKAAGQVETALGIAAHTLFEPKDERNAPAPDADAQDHRDS
ncbi:MAG TPA: hypothetical protein VES73_15115 [Lamprocystis sp. (in: g-proteobacteria)]|nr:hypothetical protein [Lamprocystis sp. (in: g-proteobacteria)]